MKNNEPTDEELRNADDAVGYLVKYRDRITNTAVRQIGVGDSVTQTALDRLIAAYCKLRKVLK